MYSQENIFFYWQRQEYSKLLAESTIEMKIVKLFFLGHPSAGKTTLKKALIKVAYIFSMWFIDKQQQHKLSRHLQYNVASQTL